MSESLRLRLLTSADLPFADTLRSLVGWNQTLKDWQRFLATEPEGCFLAEWNGIRAGTATTTVYGAGLAWIGMVLVHPDHRRRGIGRALLEHCIAHLRGRGVGCIKLDATPAGKPVYDGLGFRDEWTLRRWVRAPAPLPPATPGPALRTWQATDGPRVEALDAAAFGHSRQRLLPTLARQSSVGLVLETEAGDIGGYGLLRAGSQASYLGPVVASSAADGLHIVEHLVAQSQSQKLYWDIPDDNTAACSWASQHAFTVQRPLTRMWLGENLAPGNPAGQFALAGPEIG